MTKFQYPEARVDEDVVEDFHGVKVKDPYRWLEDPDSEETKAYVDAQNNITQPYLAACPYRETVHARLKQLWDFPKYSCPTKVKDRYYFTKNSGLQNQSVLYVQDTLESEPRVFFDPNTLSSDGSVALKSRKFSKDGSILAYKLSESGSEWDTIHFMNTITGEKYPEVLEQVKYSALTWTHDNLGIFYGRYAHQKGMDTGTETEKSTNQKLYYHRVGTPQSEDVVVVEFPEEPSWTIGAQVTDCGNWLLIIPMKECKDNMLYIHKLEAGKKIDGLLSYEKVIDVLEDDYEYVTNDGSKAIFRTNKNAPNFRLIAIDLNNYKEENWIELIPEHSYNILDWASGADHDKIVTCYIEDVHSVLQLHSLKSGQLLKTFPLQVGTIVGFSGDIEYSEIFYQFTSFLTPGIIYTTDLRKDEASKVLREIKVSDFDRSLYKTIQIFYKGKDGTKIPMFVVMKEDTVLDGSSPTLLYAYGGFNQSIQPTFSVTRLVFIQHFNGILAIPNVRGGGEYGEKWHAQGCLFNKQNTFDDILCAAEYLIEHGYTSPQKLTIEGGSNGGLSVAACVNQRPDLFGAAVAHVGVLDMLRFHKFTCGYMWISDYGCSDEPKHFDNLYKFSPLHNVREPKNGGQYPAFLLLTADHDGRVVPLHSLKFIATLQKEIGKLPQQKNPLLIKVDTKAGHGMGKPTVKVLEESADVLTFIGKSLGLEFKP